MASPCGIFANKIHESLLILQTESAKKLRLISWREGVSDDAGVLRIASGFEWKNLKKPGLLEYLLRGR